MVVTCCAPLLRAGEDAESGVVRIAVRSSHLASVRYRAARQTLEIEFRNGSAYRYFAVPREVFGALLRAESKGRFFNREIRERYEFVRLRPEAACD